MPEGRQGRGRRASQAYGLEAGEGLDVAGDGGLAPAACAGLRSFGRPENRLDATSAVRGRQWGMLPTMFEVGCDLLRLAGLALAARGFEFLGENLLRIGMEMVEGDAGGIEPARRTASPN